MAEETGMSSAAGAPKTVGTPPVRKAFPVNTMMMITGGVVLIVALFLAGILFKPSITAMSSTREGQSRYVPVFTRLELKEAAQIRDALEAKGIKSYRLEDDGHTISVLRKEADNARLAMALAGLPTGGGIGYEIFDKGGALGATDFDKRIKLTRALNGELSRNISRIFGIEEARVQIVMPEKQLFETKKVPVTSAIFVRLAKGMQLAPLQVKGIVHLVASSVEDLATENVTVVDYSGRILSSPDYEEFYNGWLDKQEQEKALLLASSRKGKLTAVTEIEPLLTEKRSGETQKKYLTPQEKMEARIRYKNSLEKSLENKSQIVLDQFFPAGASLSKINVELKTFDESQADDSSAIARITSIILLDENNKTMVLTPETKEAVFKAVAAVTGYQRGRDRLDLRWAPLAALRGSPALQGKLGLETQARSGFLEMGEAKMFGKAVLYGGILLILFFMLKKMFTGRKPVKEMAGADMLAPEGRGGDLSGLQGPNLNDFQDAANKDPEKLAEALKAWLTE